MEEKKVLHSAVSGLLQVLMTATTHRKQQQQHRAHNSLSRTAASGECAGYRSVSEQGLTAAAQDER